jgi:hypothetical protein
MKRSEMNVITAWGSSLVPGLSSYLLREVRKHKQKLYIEMYFVIVIS